VIELRSEAAIDAPFGSPAPDRAGAPLVEYGFRGLPAGEEPLPAGAAVSGFVPGDRPDAHRARLARLREEGRAFRFLFAERLHEPAIEARHLFQAGAIGEPAHLFVKAAAHPARLLDPRAALDDDNAWLCEPALNRLALAVWIMGPVRDARIVRSRAPGAAAAVVALRHEAPARLSVLEVAASSELTEGGAPAIRDGFECTGSDGFLRVGGIWQEAAGAPRLAIHRGGEEIARRDLRRDFAQVYERAARERGEIARRSKESYALADAYLAACARVLSTAPLRAGSCE
jgi:predicted dehydrogenase